MERQTMPEDLPRHVRSDDPTRPFTAMGSSTVHLEALQTPSLGRKSSAGSVPHATRLEPPGGEFDVRKFILDQKGSEPLHQSSLFRAAPFKEQPRPKSRNSTKGAHAAPENYPSSKKLLPRMDLKGSKSAGTLPTSVIGIGSDGAERMNKVWATSTTGRGVSLNQEHDEEYDTVSHFYTIEKMAESCCHATQNRNKTWHFLPGSEERSKGNNGASGVVGSSITGVERPSRRVDVLDLEKCFDTAIKFVNRKNKWDVACDEKLAMIDRDIMSIEARVAQKYSSASCDDQSGRADESLDDQKILVKLFFEQKWSDVILGELEAMLTMSFLEQGVVLRNARIQYAQAFFHLEQLYCARSKDLKQTLRDLEKMRQQILQTSEDHQRDTIDMKEQYEAEIRRLNIGFEARKEEMEKKVIESKEQMTKMGDTMKTLNTIFRQMREDTEKVKAVELRENYSKLEKKYELCREEIERLRPLIQENQKLTDEKEAAEREIEALKEKIAHMDTILLSKDETIANLMEQQSDMLAAQELREAQEEERRKRAQDDAEDDEDEPNAPAVSSWSSQSPSEPNEARSRQNSVAICIQCKQNMKDMFSQGVLADQENNSTQAAQATGENVDVGLLDQDRKVSEIKKRRIQCLYFRIMLPNLRGRRPHKDIAWTFSCMRSILFAKQIDDSMCRKNGGSFPLRIRMPEFVYSWFSPWRSIKDEKNQDEYGAGYADAGDSNNEHDSGSAAAASQPTLTPEQQQMQADENRWCLYYGVKALVQEGYLEAKLFLSLLDEKYGEDELVFMLYCYRVLDVLIGGRLNWGPFRECVSYEKFCREFERSVDVASNAKRVPKTVWISPYHASLATGVVLSKATESERAALDKKILGYVVTSVPEEEKPTIFLPPERPRSGRRLSNIRHGHYDALQANQYNGNDDNEDQAPQQFVDANLWVELMMLEYKEEQAHRRAAIRLMFQTATSSMGSLGTSSRLSDTREFVPAGGISAATMDMEQFRIMIRTLNDEIPSFMVAALFRSTYVKGNGVVNFDAFMDVAESAQFFSSCMRLESPAAGIPRHVGEPSLPTSAAMSTSSRATYIVEKCFAVMGKDLISMIEALPQWTRSMTDYLSYEISSALQDNESAASDGIRLLTSFHRLVDNLLLVKLVKRETTGGLLNSKSLFNMEKALNSLMECVRSRDKASVEILIDAVKQKMCVKRLQNVFREHLARDQGAPLVMRPLLHQQYGRINSDYRSRHATRPVQWLHHAISAILRKTMQSEHISSLLLQLSVTTTAFTGVSSMENSSSSTLNGGIGPAPKPILMELIYDFFLEKFGSRWEAEKLIHDLFVNCRLHKSNSMVMLFSALCCMANASPDERLLGQNEALAFLHGIFRSGLHNFRVINPQAFVLNVKGSDGGASESESIDTELQDWLPIDVAENILITAFSKISVDQKQCLQVRIGEAAAASHHTDMDKSLQSNKTQTIEAGAFLILALLEWKRYIVQKMNEVKLVCCTLEDEMHQLEKLSQIDAIASVLKKSSVSYTNDDLCFVFRRYCMTEQHYADRKGDTTVQSKNQELVSDRLAAACFPLLAREPLNELLSIENSAVEPFKLAPNPNQSYDFLISSWSGYREQCHQLLDELRRVEKNSGIQAESFSCRTPAVNSGSRASNREVLYSSSSTSSDRLSSQDIAQHEAVYLLFNERLERLAELFEKDRITINTGGSRRSSVNVDNDESNSLVDEMHSRVVMVNETWKIFRQVLLGFIKLRSFASLGKGMLPDKWSQLQ